MKVYLLHCNERHGDFSWIGGIFKNKSTAEKEMTRRILEDNKNREEDTYYRIGEEKLNEQ